MTYSDWTPYAAAVDRWQFTEQPDPGDTLPDEPNDPVPDPEGEPE